MTFPTFSRGSDMPKMVEIFTGPVSVFYQIVSVKTIRYFKSEGRQRPWD